MRPAPLPFDDLPLWSAPPAQQNTRDMHRRNDCDTSIAASEKVAPKRNELQERVYDLLAARGPMTDGEIEAIITHVGTKKLAPSTVRKRRSELFQAERIVDTGVRRGGMRVWQVKIQTGESNVNGNA